MIKPQNSTWLLAVPMTLVLATSGCATKKYARAQVAPVRQEVAQLEAKTNDKIGAIWAKQNTDMSQVNERIATTDLKLSQTAAATQEAQESASRAQESASRAQESAAHAMEQTDANSTAITGLASGVANALNYKLVEDADVTFGFNKSTLSTEAKTALDEVANKAQAQPRAIVEVAGFTDKSGSKEYNLVLSRRRAEAVERYLVAQNVPLRSIHVIGLGEEAPPQGLEAELQAANPNASKSELHRLARRVRIRVFGAGDITQSSSTSGTQSSDSAANSNM